MLCPNCHGRHIIATPQGEQPCPECGGMGEIHCCDGLQEQDGFEEIPVCRRRDSFAEPLTVIAPH